MKYAPFAIAALLLCPTVALAAPPNDAERLFLEGREAFKQGDLKTACAKFEQADALESTFGTLTNLGTCAENDGNWVNAWRLFQLAENKTDATQAERRAFVRTHRLAAENHLVTFLLPTGATSPTVDEAPAPLAISDGPTRIVAVPGAHQVTALVGGARVVGSCGGAAGEQRPCALSASDAPVLLHTADDVPVQAPVPVTASRTGNPAVATTGKILAGVGAAALVTGLVFGAVAWSGSSAASTCTAANGQRVCANDITRSQAESAQRAALVSTVAVIGGVVVGGAGTGLWLFSSPHDGEKSAGFRVSGTF